MNDVQSVAEETGRAQPAWAQAVGYLAAILSFTFIMLFVVASCTARPSAEGRVTVIDTADMVASSTESALRKIRFPADTPLIVKTVDSIPMERIGTYATDLMEHEPYWQILRPRGFLRRYIRQDVPSDSGIYLLVSRDPRLVQIRFGRAIRMDAYQAGLAAGTWYRAQQEFTDEQQLVTTVRDLASRMSDIADPFWLIGWARYLGSLTASEIEDFLAPSDGLYSNSILRRYIELANRVGATGSVWAFAAFNVVCFVALWLVGKKLIIQRWLLPRLKAPFPRFTVLAVSNVGLLGLILTGFAALALLSRGRIEDELALGALGLSFLSTTGFDPAWFSVNGGLWLAIPGAVVSFVAEVIESGAESAEARRHGEERVTMTFGWLLWACALYLLPMSIGMPALIVLLWNAGSTVLDARSETRAPTQAI